MAAPFDPLSPEVREDPYPFYRALRRAGAVHEMVGGGFVLVRNADVRAALSRPDLFSSTAMRHARCKKRNMPFVSFVFHGLLSASAPMYIS